MQVQEGKPVPRIFTGDDLNPARRAGEDFAAYRKRRANEKIVLNYYLRMGRRRFMSTAESQAAR